MQRTLANLGTSAADLGDAVKRLAELVAETRDLTDEPYQPRYELPT